MTQKHTFRCANCGESSDYRERITRRVEPAAPRWTEIEERAGLAAHQLAEIRFNPGLRTASSR
jgi:hypothetical protein